MEAPGDRPGHRRPWWPAWLAGRGRLSLSAAAVLLLVVAGATVATTTGHDGRTGGGDAARSPHSGRVGQPGDGGATARIEASASAQAGLLPSPGPSTSASAPAAGGASCGVADQLVPKCGAWLSIWPRTRSDGTVSTDLYGNMQSLEGRLGERIDLVSRYYGWTQLPPDGTDAKLRDSGHVLLIDLRARNFSTNTYVQWRDIAAGKYDDYLRTVGGRLRDFRTPVFFSFNQEPEQELEKGTQVAGTQTEFAAAYRHVHDVVEGTGAHNVVWVWWIMGYTGYNSWYSTLYPGDRYVDWISYDPYDFNRCHNTGYETASQSVLPFLDWLGRSGPGKGKPVMLSEFGSNGTARGGWYRELGTVVKRAPRIKAIISFNSNPGGCDTRVTASADNWQGFASIAADPYFSQAAPSGP